MRVKRRVPTFEATRYVANAPQMLLDALAALGATSAPDPGEPGALLITHSAGLFVIRDGDWLFVDDGGQPFIVRSLRFGSDFEPA